ncbi:hypothetical protein FRE64_16535 (plasmid) [Euhalothece natronophila Z-M001]|uniref:Uncharacterized protein n=1 Tax=Euhalothece natronophila Z-M001 TaxID=522448 RepID=A0A5B8NU60_9CHRO|nr:hypothetical protein [Euhalothece natronophila]QDZ41580.1 hypothetical protein FRE64_16535 [Euhalothece natronophila Z-M001]
MESAGGKVPSSRPVAQTTQPLKERATQNSHESNPHYVGEICQFRVKDHPNLREFLDFGGLVSQVHDYYLEARRG